MGSENGMDRSVRNQITPILAEMLRQIIAWGLAAYAMSLFNLTNLSFPWSIVVFIAGVFISYGLLEVASIYFRELVGSGRNELGKERTSRRWLAIRYLVTLVILLVVPVALYTFEYNGER